MTRPTRPHRLGRAYGAYTLGLLFFVAGLAVLERLGLSRAAIGYAFLVATVMLYAGIGILSRTNDIDEYYVAGRRVPAPYNGMAIAADWMSAASFIGLAGGLYLQGYAGLAFVMGWTGGYVLVALLLAPYLRKFGRFTIPDFLAARFGGHIPRAIGLVIVIVCSFVYVVAQLYGVGLITTRLTGVDFTVGIFLGLAGVLVCSFLGGMRAVTWTQVAQYIILIVAYLASVIWLSVNQTGTVLPQFAYGQQLKEITRIEEQILADPKENEVRRIMLERARVAQEKLRSPTVTYLEERTTLERALLLARASLDEGQIRQAEDALARHPKTEAAARDLWRSEAALEGKAAPMVRHAEPFPGQDEASRSAGRRNFIALIFCLMLGTAALPHMLVRYYTTPSVRAARSSVAWALFFILLLYLTAPALAVLVKHAVYSDVVGAAFGGLPDWILQWQRAAPDLLSVVDFNGDGVVQRAEIAIDGDIVVLATPEIAGLPYVIAGLVAAGGLAAALSTADGLLLTISSALSHDLYHRIVSPRAPSARRVLLSKILLLLVAMSAAAVAALKPTNILFLVSAAFSVAAAGFFPALVLGIFWKRATGLGASIGMLAGAGVTIWYMVRTEPWLRELFLGLRGPVPPTEQWLGIEPIAAGVFGVPVGFAAIVVVSLMTPPPATRTQVLIDSIRHPGP